MTITITVADEKGVIVEEHAIVVATEIDAVYVFDAAVDAARESASESDI